MIVLFLMLAAQAPASTPDAEPLAADEPPAASQPAPRRVCRKTPGSDTITCDVTAQQQLGYRLPRYGPAAPHSNSGKDVKLGAQVINRGPARRKRSMATVGIPF